MKINTYFFIDKIKEYFSKLPLAQKGFSKKVNVCTSYTNDVVETPKIVVRELNNVNYINTNYGERISKVTLQIDVYAGLTKLNGTAITGDQIVDHISMLLNELLGRQYGLNRVGNVPPVPSGENDTTEYVKSTRYNYLYDLDTDNFYTK